MKEIFPEPISKLPQADMPFEGVKAFLSQSDNHQIIFTSFTEDTEMRVHSHAAQISFVVLGRIDFTIGEESFSYKKGDRFYIPAGVEHCGKVYAGYADITFIDEPDRYAVY
jgi:mannose-6-phosphate isomerase-like protein (cupin superfamily)